MEYSPGTGVYKGGNTITWSPFIGDVFDWIVQPEGKDNEGPNGDPNYQDNKYHNPFNWSFGSDFIRTRDQLNVYGDLVSEGNTEADSVPTCTAGDRMNLSFSVDLSDVSKWANTRFWQNINGWSKGEAWRTLGTEGLVYSDAELVFTLALPEGVTLPADAKVTVSGLDGFRLTREDTDGQPTFKVRKIQNEQGYSTAADYYAALKKISNVSININGLAISETAPTDANMTITGTVSGMQDELNAVDKEKNPQSDEGGRNYFFFVAQQSNTGRDAAAPQDKPKQISYSFKVTKKTGTVVVSYVDENGKQIANSVTLTGKEGASYATEKKSIDGYTFKDMSKDSAPATGTYTNGTVTVTYVYTKNASDTPDTPSTPDKPDTPQTPGGSTPGTDKPSTPQTPGSIVAGTGTPSVTPAKPATSDKPTATTPSTVDKLSNTGSDGALALWAFALLGSGLALAGLRRKLKAEK